MKKYIFSVLFFVAAFFTCVSCYRSLDTIVDTPQNYYLLTLDNQSDVDVIWFVKADRQRRSSFLRVWKEQKTVSLRQRLIIG